MSGMPLGAACGLLAAGAAGDSRGRRRVFLGGLWLTALASVGAALAPSGWALIAARVVQGLGSAGIMACGLGLLGLVYDGPARARAAGVWAAGLGAGVAVGPILAGLVPGPDGWSGIHWICAAAAAGLATLARPRLPETPRLPAPPDLAGAVLLMVGLGCLLSALTVLRSGGIGPAAGLAAAGAALLGALAAVERRAPHPILRLDLFRRADFAGATLAAFASGAGVLALMSMVPTVLVRGLGETPLEAAAVLLAWSAVTAVAALGAGGLSFGLSPRMRVIAAMGGCTLGQLLLLLLVPGAGWAAALPGLLAAGVSNGLLNAALGHAAVQTVPPERQAMGSAANNTARYVGSAFGIELISLLTAAPGQAALFDGWRWSVLACAGASLLGIAAMLALGRRG
ncbi:MFS transporter [Rhodovulum sp. DZ06]|uniref:MFS transporter n=1 Tax=Rhodovulum sp. DZ06 TaxID=3425126 RepID=UPI003D329E30